MKNLNIRYALVKLRSENTTFGQKNTHWKDDEFMPGHFELLNSPFNKDYKPVVAHYQSAQAWVNESKEFVESVNDKIFNGKCRVIETRLTDEQITKRFNRPRHWH